MVLSQIEIAGFKSFARKTRIPFRDGLTAVVGPNGCGKTNVVDAIRWVLGEQKTGVLRSDRMENVIFNGTKNRKPLGLAEVTLGLYNEGGLLPIPQSEIRVTRRLYRSGESEYLLNQNICRLKDIVELFHDTGIGPDSYSIIELSMVEGILNDDPSDRRHLFEEAAGVSKYKHRRKQTARRLINVEEDLERAGDILREVEGQVANLRRQMRRAKRYQKLKDQWRRGQAAFARRSLQRLSTTLETNRQQLEALCGESLQRDGDITGSEAVLEKLKAEQLATENELKSLGSRLGKIESSLIRTEETLKYLKERRATLEDSRERWTRERLVLEEKQLRLKENQTALEGKVERARQHHKRSRQALRDARTVLAEAKQRKNNVRERLEKASGDRDNRQQDYLDIVGQRSRTEANIEQIDKQIVTNESRLKQIDTQLQEYQDHRKRLEKELKENEGARDRVIEALKATRMEHDQVRESLEQARLELASVTHLIEHYEAQLSWLSAAVGEGSSQQEAVQWLFSQDFPGILGTLGDVMEASESWQSAICAVLGDEIHWAVCDTRAVAVNAINQLRKAEKGQITFLPLEGVPRYRERDDPAASFAGPEVEGSAMSALRNAEPLRSLLALRLGAVVRVNGTPTPELLNRAASAGITLVTDQEDVYWPSGHLRGGQAISNQSVVVGRLQKIEELRSRIAAERKTQEGLSRRVAELETSLLSTVSKLEDQQHSQEQARGKVEESRIKLHRLSAVYEQHLDQREKLQQDIENMITQKCHLTENLESVTTQLSGSEQDIKRLEKLVRETGRELKKVEERLEILTEKENKATMSFLDASNDLENLEKEQSRVEQQLQEIQDSMENREGEVLRSAHEIEDIDSKRLEEERGLVERFKERDNLRADRDHLQQELEEARQRINQEETRLRDARRYHESTTGERHRIELEITRIEGDIQQMYDRMGDLDIPLEVLDEPENSEEDTAQSEEELTELKRKIERMEPVNLLAIEEFEAVNQRYEFLKTQRDDLIESKVILEETIDKINEVAQQKFFETFQVIRRNFQDVFSQLFGEGEADLLLSGKDLLEADISIWANPSGKKLKTLALMSGGEKALTAIALLFAIYKVKPSPFCVLDEVDAPLDDANIERFLQLLKVFSEHTQFIVVTHNKRTMEAADQLHGITMEEEGVSKLVTVQLEAIA